MVFCSFSQIKWYKANSNFHDLIVKSKYVMYYLSWNLNRHFQPINSACREIWQIYCEGKSERFGIRRATKTSLLTRSNPHLSCVCVSNLILPTCASNCLFSGENERRKQFFEEELKRLQKSLETESSRIQKPPEWVHPYCLYPQLYIID